MILSDKDIIAKIKVGDIGVGAPDVDYLSNIGASSMDLRLGKYFKVYDHARNALLDPRDPSTFKDIAKLIEIDDENTPFIVQPNEFVLGVTLEKIRIADDLVARVEGRSSLGRLGIIVHSTAGFVDAGFEGTITLEITNINRMPVALYPGMRVCQLAFETMSSRAEVPYNKKFSSKYQGQEYPEESRITADPRFVN